MPIDEQLLDKILASPQLPSLPAIALEIIALVQEDEAGVETIAEKISLDPALSSKMLKTVNSSFYGLPKTVASVQQAVIVLGLNSVKTLALGFSLVNNLTGSGGKSFDHMTFWRRSLFCATAAKELCDRLHIVQAEEVFIASLLQDVGLLALAQVLGEEYAQVIHSIDADHRKLSAAERGALGSDHCEVGAALAESWGLPPLLVESIRLHEKPDEAPENLASLIRTVSAGTLAAELIENPDDKERVGEYHRVMQSWFDLNQDEAESLLKDVFTHARETQRLFDLPTGELGKAEDILSRAHRALESVSLSCAKENNELKQANEQLRTKVQLDPVTGLLNRRQFDERLDELFLSCGEENPLSVVFIDLDNFKEVNDTHGHPAGDRLLAALAKTLLETAGDRGEVYRFGGDEFTMLCPGLTRPNAALMAEELRDGVEQTRCEVEVEGEIGQEKVTVALTASIGVATADCALYKRTEQLLKAADKAVYAAKHSGRNAVRVFVPKVKASGKSQAA